MTGDSYPRTVADGDELRIDDAPVRLTLLGSGTEPARYAVSFEPAAGQPVNAADVLVYWSAEGVSSWPPEEAFFLGTLAGAQARVFALPDGAGPGRGGLVFYSLAQQRRIEPGWSLPNEGDRR